MINGLQKEFIKKLKDVANDRFTVDVFGDVVGMFAAALEKPFSVAPDECEKRYADISRHYSKEQLDKVASLFGIVIKALETRRESFLGPVLEEIGAANTHNGQFLTPLHIAELMGRIQAEPMAGNHKRGELVTLNDPACGAGVLLIAGAERMVLAGIPQRDIFVVAGDIDQRACDITFTELSLLGYAARVEQLDSLAMKRYGRPRWTVGYYLHGTQHRKGRAE